MKNLEIILMPFVILTFTLLSCKTKSPSPENTELNGKWEFVRVYYGFTNATQTAAQAGYTERLEIDVANGRLIRLKNGNQIENTKYSISKQHESNVITFENSKEYSYYTLRTDGDKTLLSLYQRAPVGAVLADGGTFYYEKK